MESVVKNCGGSIHKEIAHKDVMEVLKELAKVINANKMRYLEDCVRFFRMVRIKFVIRYLK
jgi:hypothetical protein